MVFFLSFFQTWLDWLALQIFLYSKTFFVEFLGAYLLRTRKIIRSGQGEATHQAIFLNQCVTKTGCQSWQDVALDPVLAVACFRFLLHRSQSGNHHFSKKKIEIAQQTVRVNETPMIAQPRIGTLSIREYQLLNADVCQMFGLITKNESL